MPSPQGYSLDAVAGQKQSKQAWRIETLRRKALGDMGCCSDVTASTATMAIEFASAFTR